MSQTAVAAHIVLNGRVLPREDASISVFNQALFYSFGVYESVEVDGGVCFHLDDHLGRLLQSARLIDLPIGYDRSTMRRWVKDLIRTDDIRESLLRIIVFGPNADEDTLAYILPGPVPHYPSTFYTQGATAITYEGCRPLPQAKTLNTLVNYLALRKARRAGAHEAFLVNTEKCLTEGSRSNFFVATEGKLITPPAHQALSGITRELVWHMAEARHIEVVERPVCLAELSRLAEMFVTSTSMHVIPIVQVDGQTIADGRIGPITRLLMRDFESYYARVMGREVVPMRAAR